MKLRNELEMQNHLKEIRQVRKIQIFDACCANTIISRTKTIVQKSNNLKHIKVCFSAQVDENDNNVPHNKLPWAINFFTFMN